MTVADNDQRTAPSASTDSPDDAPGDGSSELSVVGALNIVLQNAALIVLCSAVLFVATVIVLILQPATYTSASSFMPQTRRSAPSLSGLAAQFGLSLPGEEPRQSPAFYTELIGTREILGALADARYSDPTLNRGDSVTLVDVLGKGPRTAALRRELAIRKLRKLVTTNISLKTGVIEVTVASRYPALAMQANRRLLDLVNQFNLEKRQSQAAGERRFVERRLQDVQIDLRSAEDRLQAFLQRNAIYRNSPQLSFEHDRLERAITMQQQLYTSLAQSFEQARIDEIRDSPLVTVIEEPSMPLVPEGKGLTKGGAIALFAGALLGLAIAFGRYAIQHGRAGSPDELSRFRTLLRRMARHPWRARRMRAESSPLI
ncbi:MAG: lipopolysaccharide biosynthesis protein [Gemmatimonadetes bacterium]|nr:lipopolysaccharide biosynthesis protein [Gemmatimonadota bacterium]